MNVGRAVLAGILGTVTMTAVGLWVLPLAGIPSVSPVQMLAGGFGSSALAGWSANLMVGVVLALVYAAVAPLLPGPPIAAGLLYAAAPFLLARIVVIPMVHGEPLFSGGSSTAVSVLAVHVVYGSVLGGVYGGSGQRVVQIGAKGATLLVVGAVLLGVLGQLVLGTGYGSSGRWASVGSLGLGLSAVGMLVAGFSFYAQSSAQRFESLFEAAGSGVILTDRERRVKAVNPAALSLLDIEEETIRGRRVDTVPVLAGLPSPAGLEEAPWIGHLCVGPRGREVERHLTAYAHPLSEPPGHQIVLLDRTREVVQEREMERQARLASLGETLAGVAHELNNPLTVIAAWSSLGGDPGTGPDEMREGFEIIGEQAARMKALVEELLGYSRREDGPEGMHPDALVERLVRVQRLGVGRGVRLETEIRWRGMVALSEARLEQILINLLSNAADAAPKSGGRVVLTLEEEQGALVVRVSDNGSGVPASMRDRIFDPFVTTKPEGVGTGLGLPISRRLARAMGGDLTVEDRPGGGAVFTLRVPGSISIPDRHPVPRAEVKGGVA